MRTAPRATPRSQAEATRLRGHRRTHATRVPKPTTVPPPGAAACPRTRLNPHSYSAGARRDGRAGSAGPARLATLHHPLQPALAVWRHVSRMHRCDPVNQFHYNVRARSAAPTRSRLRRWEAAATISMQRFQPMARSPVASARITHESAGLSPRYIQPFGRTSHHEEERYSVWYPVVPARVSLTILTCS